MRVEKKLSKSLQKSAVVASALILSFVFLPGSANAVETQLTLGSASTYGVLASSTITNAAASTVTGTAGGDIGIGSATAATGQISFTGAQVLGGASLAALTSASSALGENRAGATTGVELGGGRTITPGAYTNGTFDITGALTMDAGGVPNAVFIFRSASTLVTALSSTVTLANGAQACNVYWQVGSSATLGASSTMVGHIIAQASISTGASSNVTGQLIAVTGAVTLGGTNIVNNGCSTAAPVTTSTSTTPSTATSAAPTTVTSAPAESTNAATAVVATSTLRIVKVVVNSHGSKALPGSFTLQVSRGGVEVAKGPLSAAGITLTLVPGTYVLSEMPETGYRGVWSGAITAGGTVTLVAGQDLTVTRTNYDIGTTVVSPVTTPVVPTPDPVVPTETGGKLPNTSTPWGNWMLLGTLLMLVGGFGFASRKILAK